MPRRLGPKRANNIRKLFNLSKHDDVRKYVVRHPLPEKEGKKPRSKAPKIQRLITPEVLQRRRRVLKIKRKRAEKRKEQQNDYAKVIAKYRKQQRDRKRRDSVRRKRTTSTRNSKK